MCHVYGLFTTHHMFAEYFNNIILLNRNDKYNKIELFTIK